MSQESIKNKKTIVNITALANLENIFINGLLPRAEVSPNFDIADPEIIKKRKCNGLEKYVPFHFFMKNPFDCSVMKRYNNNKFVYLSVLRDVARNNGFLILPKHPLHNEDKIELLSYDDGFERINWEVMDKRDYSDNECKNTCMAECLSPSVVPLSMIYSIIVPDKDTYKILDELKKKYSYQGYIDKNNFCFII
ncbi:MAG: DarT ssDNA thymidine ADP-ribosyltransferase family protein [Treponema sp.]